MKRAAAFASIVLGVLLGGGVAQADTPAAFYTTPGCGSAPVWTIGYRIWGSTSDGTKAPASVIATAKDQARSFAEQVGAMSACGIRIAIDVYDLTGSVWQLQTYKGANDWIYEDEAADAQSFRDAHGYDSVFDSYPLGAIRGYDGLTYPADRVSLFPVLPPYVEPPWILLMHEWLHQVVWFYRDVAWPSNDVHGACEHGYTGASCGLIQAYFADLLQGKVAENGRSLGIRPEDWLRDGTPVHPNAPQIIPVRPKATPFGVTGFEVPAPTDSSFLRPDQLNGVVFTFDTSRRPEHEPRIWLEHFDSGWKPFGVTSATAAFDASGTHGTITLAQLVPGGLGNGSYRLAWSFPESTPVSGVSKEFDVLAPPPQLLSVTVPPRVSLRGLRRASVVIVLDKPGEIDIRVDRLMGRRWRVIWWHFVDAQQTTTLPLAPFVTTSKGTLAGGYRIRVSTQGSVALDAPPTASFTLGP